MPKILVLDGNQRSALAVTRSLGKLGGAIFVTDDSTRSLAGESKYVTDYIQSPSVKDHPEQFLQWFIEFVTEQNIEYAFPVTEITSQFLLQNQNSLPEKVKLPFADIDTIMQLADKCQLMKLAEKVGVLHPKTRYFQSIDELDIEQENEFPIVLKPGLSRVFLGNRWLETTVQILYTKEDLIKLIKKQDEFLKFPFMLQEFIPGNGAGIFTIYDRGKEKAFFAHKRIREKPPTGGVSVLSESAHLDPEMLDSARKILDSANWHGVAMVEFRVSEKGEPYLMEVNTRFWGSLQLSIDSGVDFPKMLFDITQGKDIHSVDNYKLGQQLRWLLGDVDSLYLVIKSSKFNFLQKLFRAVAFFVPRFYKRRFEVNRLGDLKPAMFELKQYLKDLAN